MRLFEACSDEPNMEYAMVDATIVKVHHDGQGAKEGTQNQATGRSKGDMTTKILALTDALGNLVLRTVAGASVRSVGVESLLDGVEFGGLIADKAFDSNAVIIVLDTRGAKIVISQHSRRANPLPLDRNIYKWWHLIENFFYKFKEFKHLAMRADCHFPFKSRNRSSAFFNMLRRQVI